MKAMIIGLAAMITLCACQPSPSKTIPSALPLQGTWHLLQATVIEGGDTTVTDYTKNVSFIKIINDTHFAFLSHDVNGGKDSTKSFTAGGGTYTLKDSTYTEHLKYFTDRAWEGHDFTLTVRIQNDTLVQSGVEKIAAANIDRINIEKYVRVK